jgi:hypothetical protein
LLQLVASSGGDGVLLALAVRLQAREHVQLVANLVDDDHAVAVAADASEAVRPPHEKGYGLHH